MAACVIPFPARRPAAAPSKYDFIKDLVKEAFLSTPPAPAPTNREDEILKLLRRIDRRLAHLTTVQGTPP
jgi:hypothetical protein